MDRIVRNMEQADWEQVALIYLEGINTGKSTFQGEVPPWEIWDAGHIKTCRLLACEGSEVLGWAALTPFSSRAVYSGVADLSIYIGEKHRGQGVGRLLLAAIIEESEKLGFWTLQSKIIGENTASIELHKKCGFRVIGYKEKLGRMPNGIWHDIVLMERRSNTMGRD